MRSLSYLFIVIAIASFAPSTSAQAQKHPAPSPKILSAKTIYFEDKTGVQPVVQKTLDQLKKWGRFQIIEDPLQADLIFSLSTDPRDKGQIIFGGGQTGTMSADGKIAEDPIPNYGAQSFVRYAFLTVIDPQTGNALWSSSRPWGGLLTGFNSAGARLVRKLQNQIKSTVP